MRAEQAPDAERRAPLPQGHAHAHRRHYFQIAAVQLGKAASPQNMHLCGPEIFRKEGARGS